MPSQEYARRVISNVTDHFSTAQRHPEVDIAWIERTLITPHYQETDADGRELYYGAVPEMGHWLRVVVENDQLLTAYLDRRLITRWGVPT